MSTRTSSHHLGGKAASLLSLAETPCTIPPWFTVAEDSSMTADKIIETAQKLTNSYSGQTFAVRSSARVEDGAEQSFAGQFDSYLYVPLSEIPSRIQQVQHSHLNKHIESYQSGQPSITESSSDQRTPLEKPTALIQLMLTPEVSGVAFSANPVTGNRQQCVISALWGTGSALVSGDADADLWVVDEQPHIIETTLAHKSHQHIASSKSKDGVILVETPINQRDIPSLTHEQILEVADLTRFCASHFGCPQDIEWAYEGLTLYLLQSRPITTLENSPKQINLHPDPNAPLTVWDNSNIAESYSGITSPLTFSFAKRIYEHVYREFCALLSVPQNRIRANDAVFPEMLGHIKGHVYYNLNSWYHVLAMLPGFSVNRSFMEQMMGVKEPMPDEVVQSILKQTQTGKFKDSLALVKTVGGLIKNHRSLQQQIDAFYTRLNTALNAPTKPLSSMSGQELTAHYRDLENQLLKRWDAPLINDFFAMIYYGVLKSLCKKWLNDESLQNNLLLDAGDIISAEPPRRILAMAKHCAINPELTDLLVNPDAETSYKLKNLELNPELAREYHRYLEDFGDRCLEELKLESPTVGDNPETLLTSIGVTAKRQRQIPEKNNTKTAKTTSPQPTEIPQSLGGIKRKIFLWVLKNTKHRIRDRENLRFERTRLFGRVRKIIVEMGHRLHKENLINDPKDVFFLTIDETLGVYENTTPPESIRQRCAERKQTQASFTTPPPDRFETRGPIENYSHFTPTASTQSREMSAHPDQFSGTGACPGIVRGPVRVVTDPRQATLREGEILVAQQTDPGWVVLFPAASGLLVERGSLLSHSAIVARELQLPCIVSITKVTSRLKTGDVIEMNGSTGEIRLLK